MESSNTSGRASFGASIRAEHFLFDRAYVPLNHGSYGAFPKAVRDHQRALQDSVEAQTDPFIRFSIPALLDQAREAIAPLLGASTGEVVYVPNATTAVNVVLRNLAFAKRDVILYFNTTYGACEKTVKYICESTEAEAYRIELVLPLEDHELVDAFRDAVSKVKGAGNRPRIALLDTVVTFPGVRMPWEALVEACRDLEVLSLIDGAHGVGHIDLTHLGRVSPDFFTSNCYKWLYTPRACAVFYVPTRNQHLIHSSVPTSHGFQPSPQEEPDRAAPDGQPQPNRFVELFKWVATIDQTPYLCVPAALQFRRSICGGEEAILQYAHDLAQNGGQAAASILGTEMMDNNSHTLSRCCFATIRLPIAFVSENDCGRRDEGDKDIQYEPTEGPKLVTEIMNRCLKDFNTWIPGKFYAGQAWVRLSAQTYLAQADFEWAARVLKDICADLRKPRWTAAATT